MINLSLKNIKFEYVKVKDAEFILNLRLNNKLNRFISKVDSKLSSQIKWIEEYKQRERNGTEHYFIIKDLNNKKIGTIRVYNITENECVWGSWIIDSNNPLYAIESVILIYKFIFEVLNKNLAKFDVMKNNKTVIMFHKSYGAKIVGEDDLNYYFIFKKQDYPKLREKFIRYIQN